MKHIKIAALPFVFFAFVPMNAFASPNRSVCYKSFFSSTYELRCWSESAQKYIRGKKFENYAACAAEAVLGGCDKIGSNYEEPAVQNASQTEQIEEHPAESEI